MKRSSCLNCGADVALHYDGSVYVVCPYCQSSLLRNDLDLTLLGKTSEVMTGWSPIQIGVTGTFEGRGFTVLGGLRIGWDKGFWHEWFCLSATHEELWLGEAQGFYSMSRRVDLNGWTPESLDIYKPGQPAWLPNQSEHMTVEDVRGVVCEGSEGELPFASPKGARSVNVDFTGSSRGFAGLEVGEDSETRLYVGQYVDFDAFQFKGLRVVDGW